MLRSAGRADVVCEDWLSRSGPVESIELESDVGVVLRGFFYDAGEGPLVVHFLGSGASVTTGAEFDWGDTYGLSTAIRGFHEAGCSSLAVDYRGIGRSSGERDVRRLVDDAWTIWLEALRRVNGHSHRIVLRGNSLGTLAIAGLLERGADPACVLLSAPVRAETIVENWIAFYHSRVLSWVVSPFLRCPLDVNLERALESYDGEVAVIVGARDGLMTGDEKTELARFVAARGGNFGIVDADHIRLIHRVYSGPMEDEFETMICALANFDVPQKTRSRMGRVKRPATNAAGPR